MTTSEKSHGLKTCGACGAISRRGTARFCLVCGSLLNGDGAEVYRPLDKLRASYLTRPEFRAPDDETPDLFEVPRNGAAESARACLAFALVPFLGIIFVPPTLFAAVVGWRVSVRRPRLGGGRRALASAALSVVVLGGQMALWWALCHFAELGATP